MQTRTVTPIIQVHPDYDSDTNDADCYTPSQVAAFRAGEWSYVGIVPIVEVSDGFTCVRIEGASLWGIDYGCPATNEDDTPSTESYDHDAYLREAAREQFEDVPKDIAACLGVIDWTTARLAWSA